MRKAIIRNNMILLISAFILFFTVAFFSLYYFENRSRESFMTFILNEVEISYDQYDGTPSDFVSTYSYLDRRITILDENGYVLADSHDQEIGQDKSERPEILDLGSIKTRTSDTIGTELLYMATRLDNGYYLRVSVPLEIQTGIYNQVTWIIIIGAALITAIYYFSLQRVNKNILSPLEKIKRGLEDLNKGQYQVMSLNNHYADVNVLLHEMNMINLETSKYVKQVESYRQRLITILNHLKQSVLLFDENENLSYFNVDASTLFDLTDSDLNQPIYRALRESDIREAVHETNIKKRDMNFDITINEVIYEVQTIKLDFPEDLKNQPTVLVIVHDVLKERQLSQVKRDFFSYASHELKSPITAISGHAELLKHGIINDEKEIEETADIILEQSKNMTLLVEDMLMLARLEQVQSKELKVQNLNDILKLAIKNMKIFSESKNIKIIVDEKPVKMVCDPLDIDKLFKNIIENAIKYSDKNKQVNVMLHAKNDGIIFSVEDQGYGISLEHQQRVFERFYRVDKGRQDGGTGLGLAIVKHIVLKYHGTINLKSAIGKGTTIEIFMKDFHQ